MLWDEDLLVGGPFVGTMASSLVGGPLASIRQYPLVSAAFNSENTKYKYDVITVLFKRLGTRLLCEADGRYSVVFL